MDDHHVNAHLLGSFRDGRGEPPGTLRAFSADRTADALQHHVLRNAGLFLAGVNLDRDSFALHDERVAFACRHNHRLIENLRDLVCLCERRASCLVRVFERLLRLLAEHSADCTSNSTSNGTSDESGGTSDGSGCGTNHGTNLAALAPR